MAKDSFLGVTPAGFHRVVYETFGTPNPLKTIICVHGLTRNRGDFLYLAEALSKDAFVVTVDLVGRGESDRLKDPSYYHYPQYVYDLIALLARLNVQQVDWIGTSMGGLIGMLLASLEKSPIRRLVMNDVGPMIPKAAIERLKTYASVKLTFKTREEAEDVLRKIFTPFGFLPEDRWQNLFHNTLTTEADGSIGLNYDHHAMQEKKSEAFAKQDPEGNLIFWEYWERITSPIYLIQGEQSDILSSQLVDDMKRRKTGTPLESVMIKDTGHAPSLMLPDQITLIKDWLSKPIGPS
ncbi:MAG: alpha/beta fold hydrolase [Candidatus Nucleicultricaceae bacterium]